MQSENKPLSKLKVIDLSHRLPGPFAGKILADLGAQVIKIEDHEFKDPFLSGLFSSFDQSFISWYENLNQMKKIMRFDFNSPDDAKEIQEIVKGADAVIMGLPPKTRSKLSLEDKNLNFNRPFVRIELLSSQKEKKSMHDLNALAMSGLLSLFVSSETHEKGENPSIINPPFLPIAGISFGHKAATDLLAALYLAQEKKSSVFTETYLDEATEELLGIFWPKSDREANRTRFLHNGSYPCYSIYQTRDHKFVALAAVEEKFWIRFCEVFSLPPHLDRFYCKDNLIFNQVALKMGALTQEEISQLIEKEDICLSLI